MADSAGVEAEATGDVGESLVRDFTATADPPGPSVAPSLHTLDLDASALASRRSAGRYAGAQEDDVAEEDELGAQEDEEDEAGLGEASIEYSEGALGGGASGGSAGAGGSGVVAEEDEAAAAEAVVSREGSGGVGEEGGLEVEYSQDAAEEEEQASRGVVQVGRGVGAGTSLRGSLIGAVDLVGCGAPAGRSCCAAQANEARRRCCLLYPRT
jgi:hypothetical protein